MISKGQIEFIRGGILANVRSDGRVNGEKRRYQIQPNYLRYTNGSCKIESDIIIYTGIKLELADQPAIKITISSVKDNTKNLYLERLLESYFKQDTQRVSKKGWLFNIEVFLLAKVDDAYTEIIAKSISEALANLKIPEIEVTQNYLTQLEEYSIIEGQFAQVNFTIPIVHVIGQIEDSFIKDMTFEEFHSVDKKYIVSGTNINSFGTLTDPFLPEDFLRVLEFIQ